jgi:hypothetical protein
MNDLTRDNFAVARRSLENGKSLNVISAYFKYRVPTENLVKELKDILRVCGDSTLIGANINAFSRS